MQWELSIGLVLNRGLLQIIGSIGSSILLLGKLGLSGRGSVDGLVGGGKLLRRFVGSSIRGGKLRFFCFSF